MIEDPKQYLLDSLVESVMHNDLGQLNELLTLDVNPQRLSRQCSTHAAAFRSVAQSCIGGTIALVLRS